MTFNTRDLLDLKARGISLARAEQQLAYFATGFPFLQVVAPATPAYGIRVLDQVRQGHYLELYENWQGSRVKFVPASGAASRMFKALFAQLEAWHKDGGSPASRETEIFLASLKRFAFYPALQACKGYNAAEPATVLECLLGAQGLHYGALPKGLLAFHAYPGGPRTPFEEHLAEAATYAAGQGKAHVHFTVSAEHLPHFKALAEKVQQGYENAFGLQYQIDFSVQQPGTDTLAADENNLPFRDADGRLVFRPGGHGALLANLQTLQEDLIFVKNIDNVVAWSHLDPTKHWKKILAGVLLSLRGQMASYLKLLETGATPLQYKEVADFMSKTFFIEHPRMPEQEYGPYLYHLLNRPLRVCGMVRNTGEPGGGPFLVRAADGSTSLQILESAQFNTSDPQAMQAFRRATHFNPVDMVCCTKDYRGRPFRLQDFTDPETGFISEKSYQGRVLKAQELPGLWNGAMSRWNTVFVEVPIATFNPVKTVNDLLKAPHYQN